MGKAVACRRDINLSPLGELQYENDLYADSIYQRLMAGLRNSECEYDIPPKSGYIYIPIVKRFSLRKSNWLCGDSFLSQQKPSFVNFIIDKSLNKDFRIKKRTPLKIRIVSKLVSYYASAGNKKIVLP